MSRAWHARRTGASHVKRYCHTGFPRAMAACHQLIGEMQLEVGHRFHEIAATGAEAGVYVLLVGHTERGGLRGEERDRDVFGQLGHLVAKELHLVRGRADDQRHARKRRPEGRLGEQVVVDPRMEGHHADLAERRRHRLILRGEEHVERQRARRPSTSATPAAARSCSPTHSVVSPSSVPAGAPLCRIAPATGTSPARGRQQVRDRARAGRFAHEHDPIRVAAE